MDKTYVAKPKIGTEVEGLKTQLRFITELKNVRVEDDTVVFETDEATSKRVESFSLVASVKEHPGEYIGLKRGREEAGHV
jgi:hypothetical protein